MANGIFIVDFDAKYHLPVLQGTDNQVQYARCLRADFLMRFMDLGKPSKEKMQEIKNRFSHLLNTTPEEISRILHDIKEYNQSGWWLDNKNTPDMQRVANILNAERQLLVVKTCSSCGITKNTAKYFSTNGAYRIKSRCKACINKDHAKRRLTKKC
jgi:hypothetical protein